MNTTAVKKAYQRRGDGSALGATADDEAVRTGRRVMRERLRGCVTAAHPEMVRNADDDEPCDDGRAGE